MNTKKFLYIVLGLVALVVVAWLGLGKKGEQSETAEAVVQQVQQEDQMTGKDTESEASADVASVADEKPVDAGGTAVKPVTATGSKARNTAATSQTVEANPISAARKEELLRQALPEMVRIPAGQFRMGDLQGDGRSDQLPVHDEEVRAFALATTEATVAQYAAYAELTGLPSAAAKDKKLPVTMVSWQEAVAYAAWLSKVTGRHFRLPMEAEWEYAARAGSEAAYAWGGKMLATRAVCEGCNQWGNEGAQPVAGLKANAFGLYDMSGNVWEWVADCYRSTYADPVPSACTQYVLRGGSWADLPPASKSANRSWGAPTLRNDRIGFRLAEDL